MQAMETMQGLIGCLSGCSAIVGLLLVIEMLTRDASTQELQDLDKRIRRIETYLDIRRTRC